MGKRHLMLTVDDEMVEIAKSRRLNMSALFRGILATELAIQELSDATTKEELINKLKSKLALTTEELSIKNQENGFLKKELNDLRKEIKKLKEKTKEEKVEYISDF